MPDLAMELSHLEQADKHIAGARALIASTSALATASEGNATRQGDPDETLTTMMETLAAFEKHRELILQTIADIRAGKL